MARKVFPVTVNIEPTPLFVAQMFAAMDDEQQAQVFIEVAKISDGWSSGVLTFDQWWHVGRHLRDCECSNDSARDIVKRIAEGLEP